MDRDRLRRGRIPPRAHDGGAPPATGRHVMTEQTNTQPDWGTEEPAGSGPDADDQAAGANAGAGRTFDTQQMLNQLQGMIDQVATNSGPALRQVAAKAAELAA